MASYVRVTCDLCEQPVPCPIEHVRIFRCTDDPKHTRVGFVCGVHGEMIAPLKLDGFYLLQMEGVPVSDFTLSEVRAEQDRAIREFADRLDSVLEAILDAA